MMNFIGHFMVTFPMIIGFMIYVASIDDIRNHAVKDFTAKAVERGIMVECEGYEGYFWECNE